ncbi:MAG: hypothetical protein WBD55_08620 [Dehalococcoidia bacterium]
MAIYRLPATLLILGALALLAGACGDGGGDSNTQATPTVLDRIAFGARAPDGQYGLYIIAPDSSGLEKLSDEQGFVFFPRFSPAGDRIAYIVTDDAAAQPGALRVYDMTTRAATTLSDGALASVDGPAFSWSPDGTRLAFTNDDGQLRVVELDSGAFAELPNIKGTVPAWSPSADQVAVVAPDGVEVTLVKPDDGEQNTFFQSNEQVTSIIWSPSNDRIAIAIASGDEPPVKTVLVLDGAAKNVLTLANASDIAWSRSGERIAYSAPSPGQPGNSEIYVATADEAGDPLTATVTVERWPSWSPNGDRIVYVSEVDQRTALLCSAQFEPPERNCLDLGDLLPGAPDWG